MDERERKSRVAIEWHRDPENKKRHSELTKKALNDPEVKKLHIQRTREGWARRKAMKFECGWCGNRCMAVYRVGNVDVCQECKEELQNVDNA